MISDIRKQEEVLQESYMMIPDSKARLEKTVTTLAELVVSLVETHIVVQITMVFVTQTEATEDSEVDQVLLAEAQTIVTDQS